MTKQVTNPQTQQWQAMSRDHHLAPFSDYQQLSDSGPRIIIWIVDGVLNDGGAIRDFGWGRFPRELRDINGSARVKLAPSVRGQLGALRIYDRYLRISEIVGNHRAAT